MPAVEASITNPITPAKVVLGKTLFFDKRLSQDGSISCATCHQPNHAFSDGRALAQGIGKRIGTRNTLSIINAAFNTTQFWDGRHDSLESQALDPLLNPREHGLKDYQYILVFLRNDADYIRSFKESAMHMRR